MAKKGGKRAKKSKNKRVKRSFKKVTKTAEKPAKAKSSKSKLIIAGLLVVLVAVSLLIIQINKNVTGNTITNPPGNALSCGEEDIRAVWDSIFEENSSNTTIRTDEVQGCNYVVIKKTTNTTLYILHHYENYTNAIYGNFNETIVSGIDANLIGSEGIYAQDRLASYAYNRTYQINSAASASSAFNSRFKASSSSSWTLAGTGENQNYNFSDIQDNTSYGGIALVVKDYIEFYYNSSQQNNPSNCTPNWTAVNTTCLSSEHIIRYYQDTNNCSTSTGMPANVSYYCDKDGNGIIGDIDDADLHGVSPDIKINGTALNLSVIYSEMQAVEILDNNTVIIKFNWNFSKPLNLENITIEKQSTSSSFGYIRVNGLDISKEVIIDRISNFNSVCIKDSFIESISSISSGCNATGEYIIPCPGTNSIYACETPDSAHLKITGLAHSIALETSASNQPACTPLNCSSLGKTCGTWTESKCNTSLNCGNCNGGYECTNGICTLICVPNWSCGNWTPAKCPKSLNQTRTCNDANTCGDLTGKPNTSQSCEYKPLISKTLIIILLVIIFLVIAGIALWYFIKKKKQSQPSTAPSAPTYPQPPNAPTAPSFQPAGLPQSYPMGNLNPAVNPPQPVYAPPQPILPPQAPQQNQ